MNLKESLKESKIDLTNLILIPSGGGGSDNSDFEISPKDFLRFSKLDFHSNNRKGLINSLTNAKRAIDCQIDETFSVLGIDFQEIPNQAESKIVELPVYYSEESGPELALISNNSGLTIEEVINLHQSLTYRVYAIGFAPGFAYLGEVDQRIASPRLSTPRMKVPKGAVAIADKQTAVYPNVSPGGWNIIGLCPIAMFDANARPSMPVKVGDKVKFKAISKQAFLDLSGEIPKELGAST